MAEFINTVDLLGDEYVTGAIIDRSITEYRDDTVTIINTSAFHDCTNLTTVEFASAVRFESESFWNCTSLTKVILRNPNNISVLINTMAFRDTPINNKTGYIYVPSALIDSYKSKWSIHASQFRALEDYTVDGTITGELDESKI